MQPGFFCYFMYQVEVSAQGKVLYTDPRQIFWGAGGCSSPRNSLHPHPKKVIMNQFISKCQT